MRFECSKCNYAIDKKAMPNRCPYCGEHDAMIKAHNAQDFVNEAAPEEDRS